jgi:prepilin-type N-terminal cleavage/methylation domain-containing protein
MSHLLTARTRLARRRGTRGFSLIEVLFAIGMLGIGIVGILSLFTTGISAAAWSGNVTTAAMEAQSLYTRIVAEVDATGNRVFLCRIQDPKNPVDNPPANQWIHTINNQQDPVQIDPNRDWWWQCRVTRYSMSPEDPLDPLQDANVIDPTIKAFPMGMYQVAIAVYRNWKPGKDPRMENSIVVYTSYVTAGY